MSERKTRGGYHPARKPPNGGIEPPHKQPALPLKYLSYPKAMAQLRKRLDATPEELAAWVWLGPTMGGLSAFLRTDEVDPAPRFHFGLGLGHGLDDDHDYVSALMSCWFLVDEVDGFEPTDRYITGSALIQRWSNLPGLKPMAFILAKIRESHLLDLHPVRGLTQGSDPNDVSKPPVSEALFKLVDVKAIEADELGIDFKPGFVSTLELEPGSRRTNELQAEPAASDGRVTATAWVDSRRDGANPTADKGPTLGPIRPADPELGSPEWRSQTARAAANARHDKPGGSREKHRQIRSLWASGKYSSRDVCAEQECSALGMSFSAARTALKNTPDPTRN